MKKKIKDAIINLAPRIVFNENEASIPGFVEGIRSCIRCFMRESPEIFWFSNRYRYNEQSRILHLRYNFTPKKTEFYKHQIHNVVEHGFQPKKLAGLTQLEKVTYVYIWLVDNTSYNDYSSFNQTIFSVLINRNSVCTGYAKTAQYLLRILGVDSRLVFGNLLADKSGESRHAWNIVKIDDTWYHVDFCLADPSLKHLLAKNEIPIESRGVLWNYFCVSTERVKQNRTIESEETVPECDHCLSPVTVELVPNGRDYKVCISDAGSSSKVFLNPTDKTSVIKAVRNESDNILLENEYTILSELSGCTHILKLKGRYQQGLKLEQLTPWSQLLESHYYTPNKATLLSIFSQLTDGLIECRDRGITHSDIHYNNIYVDSKGVFKWGDFGIAFKSTRDGHLPNFMLTQDENPKGSPWFMPPETYFDKKFTETSAIYALAMVFYFVLNDMKPPYWSQDIQEEYVLEPRLNGEVIPRPTNVENKERLWEILSNCLAFNPKDRPQTFEGLKALLSATAITDMFGSSDGIGCAPVTTEYMVVEPTFEGLQIDETYDNQIDVDGSPYFIGGDGLNFDSDVFAMTCNIAPKPEESLYPIDDIYGIDDFATTDRPLLSNILPENFGKTKFFTPSEPKKSFLGKLKNAFAVSKNKTDKNNYFKSSFYVPEKVKSDDDFIVRVYFHFNSETHQVASKVKIISPESCLGDDLSFSFIPNKGDRFKVKLFTSDTIQAQVKEIVWQGYPVDCKFIVSTININKTNLGVSAQVFYNDVPVGELMSSVRIEPTKPERQLKAVVSKRQYSKIFISYAHADSSQVRGIAETCKMIGVDYFFDRHSLNPGDVFKDKILRYIENADLFVLCWSKNAAQSEWVQIERQHALMLLEEGKTSLALYPLRISPEAPLPIEMADKYNFGSL